ncbi:MAG: hypothetical protein R2700_12195 [Solirubrobacterales bacterium]
MGRADAVLGELGFLDCQAKTIADGCTAIPKNGIDGPVDMAVSPNGRSVYVLADGSSSISRFNRAANGSLTFASCIADSTAGGCVDDVQSLLLEPNGIAVSPDGKSVYTVAEGQFGLDDRVVAHFAADSDGDLHFADCQSDLGQLGGCTNREPDVLSGVSDVAVSPNGRSVYATTSLGIVTHFAANATGALSYLGCVGNDSSDGCVDQPGTPLSGATGIAVSEDGSDVYVAARARDGIAHFKADALGTLTLADCINDAGDANCANPPGTPLDGANAVALSPDGKSLYVASANADSVSHLSIGANGSPTFADCVADQASVGCTPDPGFMLDGAEDVAVSPDGANVYVASALADSLTRLNTGADGSLQYGGCLADTASGGCGDLANSPLNGADGVVVADEGGLGNVYATAGVADAVSRFSRELPVVTPLDTTPPETKIDKGPKRTSTRRKAKFVFSSSEPVSTFVCAVDGAEPKTCTSPHKVKVKVGKRPRRHRFSVAATDASGNTDATPSVLRWKVKPKMHGKHGKPGRQK